MGWIIGILIGLIIAGGGVLLYYRSAKVRARIAAEVLVAGRDAGRVEADIKAAYEKVIADIKKVI